MKMILILCLSLLASTTQAATYYVATTGDNTRSCATAQTITTPKQSIASGIACLAAGDTLYVRGGTYTDQTIQNVPSGSDAAYTTIAGYPGERPRITQSNPTGGFVRGVVISQTSATDVWHHIQISNFEFDSVYNYLKADLGNNGATEAHHIKFLNNICHDSTQVGLQIFHLTTTGGDHLIQGNTIYRTGSNYPTPPWAPGINAIYGTGNRTIIENNIFHDNVADVVIYSSQAGPPPLNNVIVRNNTIYNTGRNDLNPWMCGSTCPNSFGPAIGALSNGSGDQIYRNDIYGGRPTDATIAVLNSGPHYIYNNTLYNNASRNGSNGIMFWSSAVAGNIVRNNILYLSGAITDTSAKATSDHNLLTNPSFTNAAAADFTLTAGSPAIDAGIATISTSPAISVTFSGSAPDIGAHEYAASDTTPPAAPQNLRIQ